MLINDFYFGMRQLNVKRVFSLILTMLLVSAIPVAADEALDQLIIEIEGVLDPNGKGDDKLTLAEMMKRHRVPGVSVAVIWNHEIAWAKGYGLSDVETSKPVNTNTLFQAASISKPVNAVATLKAVQEGKFDLDDDINLVLTSWKLPENEFTRLRKVTPRMLLSHTSGTDDGFGFPGYHPEAAIPTIVQILNGSPPSNVGSVVVAREPFTRFKYSGGGATIMQLALMDVTNVPYPEMMQKFVFEPAGMTNSTFDQPLDPSLDTNAARAHNAGGKSMDAKWHVYPELAAAGLWTTPTDLCKLAIDIQLSLQGEPNRILDRKSALEMVNPVGVGDYAVGFRVTYAGEGWYFSHSGGNWGFQCYLIAHRVKGYGMAVMTNSDRGGRVGSALQKRISRAYNWDEHAEPLRN